MEQAAKARTFQQLHEREGAFILANAWDAGSARLLAHCGFEAIGTTSAGFAFSIGEADRVPDRESVLANAADIVRATSLPVSADLKNAFGTTENAVAESIALAADIGVLERRSKTPAKIPMRRCCPSSMRKAWCGRRSKPRMRKPSRSS